MLEIIGWLACLAIFVKLMEMSANRQLRNEDGQLFETATIALYIGSIALVGLALALIYQGMEARELAENASTETGASLSPETQDCILNAKTSEEVLAC